jgi:ABC-type amino acid transport substrate-binding protein
MARLVEWLTAQAPPLLLAAVVTLLAAAVVMSLAVVVMSMMRPGRRRTWTLCAGGGLLLTVTVLLTSAVDKERLAVPVLHRLPEVQVGGTLELEWDYVDVRKEGLYYRAVVRQAGEGKVFRSKATTVPPIFLLVSELPKGACDISIEVLEHDEEGSIPLGDDCTPPGPGVKVREIAVSEPVHTEIYQTSIERIRETKVLRVAIHYDRNAPGFCEPRLQPAGFDPDLASLICSGLGHQLGVTITPKFRHWPWPAVFSTPRDGSADLAIASISMTKERKDAGIRFSTPYFGGVEIGLVVPASRADLDQQGKVCIERLANAKVGVHQGTTAVGFLTDHVNAALAKMQLQPIQLRTAVDNDVLFGNLDAKEYDCIAYDVIRARSRLGTNSPWKVLRFDYESLGLESDSYAVVLADERLKECVDQVLSGEHDAIEHARSAHNLGKE